MPDQSLQKTYIMVVLLGATALTSFLAREFPVTEIGGWLAVLMWTFAVGPQSVAFPKHRVQITAADCFMFYCLVEHGPIGGISAAFIGTLGAMELGSRRPTPAQSAFNLGAVPLSAGLAGYAFSTMRVEFGFMTAMFAAAAVFAVVNTLLVSIALMLEGKAAWRQSLLHAAPGFVASVFVTAFAGGMLAGLAEQGPGDWTVAGVVAVCFLVGTVLSVARDRFQGAEAA
jgi:hypothetical protein